MSGTSIIAKIFMSLRVWIRPTLFPFLVVPWVGLQSVIVAFLSHTVAFLNCNNC